MHPRIYIRSNAPKLCILVLSTLFMNVMSRSACPLNNPKFESQSGVDGLFSFSNERATVFQYYPRKSMPNNGSDCYRSCEDWPSARAQIRNPNPLMPKSCAYWKWVSGDGCYLLGCGICSTFESFYSPNEIYKPLNGDRHCSGGPGWRQCTGGVKGDPHYSGGDQSHFDFTGVPGKHYCLISDSNIHLNVYYGGRFDTWGKNPHKPLTWIRKVGILWENHTIVMEAREGSEWEYNQGYMSKIVVDDEEIRLNQQGEEGKSKDGRVEIVWESQKIKDGNDEIDVFHLRLGKTLKLIAKLRPEVPNLRTNEDGIVHFSLSFPIAQLSENVHGILGQTYRPDHRDRISQHELEFNDLLRVNVVKGENAEGFLDGSIEQYETSGLLKDDCAFSRFSFDHSSSDGSNSLIKEWTSNSNLFSGRKLLR